MWHPHRTVQLVTPIESGESDQTADPTQRQARPHLPRHPQVQVTVDAATALVDEQLAPFIEGLWQLGISTRFSCQSTIRQLNLMPRPRNMFYVMFSDAEDLRRMLELFVNTPLDPTLRSSLWRYELYPRFSDDSAQDGDGVILHAVVFIPVEHLAEVTRTVADMAASRGEDERRGTLVANRPGPTRSAN